MKKEIQLNLSIIGALLLIILFLILLPTTDSFSNAPGEFSLGILLDLIITIPVVYFLIIRKTKIPNFTVIYVFILGLVLAGFLIPIEHQQVLSQVKLIAIPLIEIGIVGTVFYKMTALRTSLKKTKGVDFYDRLITACQEIFPSRIGRILATEIAVGYYLFSPQKRNQDNEQGFTYFKRSGIKTVVSVLLFLLVIETIVVHVLVAKWHLTVAWVLSFIGLYTMLQVIAILRSLNQRLISINGESKELILRYGFGCQTKIPFSAIDKIEKYHSSIEQNKDHVYLSLFDLLDTNNLTIHLKSEQVLHKIYGIDKKYKSISLFMDEKERFVKKMEEVIEVI